jgi:deazaflavin-dependent oxidoreductase (nitroreductase family)
MTAYRLGLGPLIGRVILLLTTTGRKTGLARVTPLQYELIDGDYIIGAALGPKSDWVRNIIADPQVQFRVKNERYTGRAKVITDVEDIVAYIEHRIAQRPIMIRLIMWLDGFKPNPSREELEEYARGLAIVRLVADKEAK